MAIPSHPHSHSQTFTTWGAKLRAGEPSSEGRPAPEWTRGYSLSQASSEGWTRDMTAHKCLTFIEEAPKIVKAQKDEPLKDATSGRGSN